MPKQNKTLARAVRKARVFSSAERAKLKDNAKKAREAYRDQVDAEDFITELQQQFVLEYPRDYNATRAYHRASFLTGRACSMGAACSSASDLLKKPYIKKLIDEADANRVRDTAITPERIVRELEKMGFTSMEDFTTPQEDGSVVTDFRKATKDNMAAVSELTVETYDEKTDDGFVPVKRIKFKLSDKRGALELLGKTQKMFVDRTSLENPDGTSLAPPALTVNFVRVKKDGT